ncbi:MAG TPA: hypothetical protein VN109_13460 [Devosia sp.]|nr:hypothetical protein [Devosia sp.]
MAYGYCASEKLLFRRVREARRHLQLPEVFERGARAIARKARWRVSLARSPERAKACWKQGNDEVWALISLIDQMNIAALREPTSDFD